MRADPRHYTNHPSASEFQRSRSRRDLDFGAVSIEMIIQWQVDAAFFAIPHFDSEILILSPDHNVPFIVAGVHVPARRRYSPQGSRGRHPQTLL